MRISDRFNFLFFYKKKSALFQRGLLNSFFSLGESIAIPLLYIIATPLLVAKLNLNQYGILMLSNSVSGVIGVLNFGTNDATVKYVSLYRGRNDETGIVNCIKSTFTINLVLSTVIITLGLILAPFLVNHVFKINLEDTSTAILALQIGIFGFGLKTVTGVFNAAIRGFERYDITTKINITSATVMMVLSVIIAYLGYGVAAILLSNLMVIGLTLVFSVIIVKRFVNNFSLVPTINKSAIREVLNFGFFSWLQSVAAIIFSQADRLIIASLLGTTALSIYSIALQVAQQVHSLVGSSLAFLFPMISSQNEVNGGSNLKNIYKKALIFSVIFSIAIAAPLLIGSKLLLTLWMGADFAKQSYELVNLLIIAYFLLALSVVPYYMLLGIGEVRFASLTNIVSGLISLIAFFFFIPLWGMNGAAIGRFLYTPILALNFFRVNSKLQKLSKL